MRIKRGLLYCLRYYGASRPTPIPGAIPERHLPVILVVSDFEPSVSRHTVLFRNHRAGITSINDIINLILFPSSIYTPNDALCFPSDFSVVPSTLTTPYSFVNNFHYSTYMPVIRSHFARPSAVSAKWAKPGGVLSQHQGLVCVGWFSAIPPQSGQDDGCRTRTDCSLQT
jgi:hypothetical protein